VVAIFRNMPSKSAECSGKGDREEKKENKSEDASDEIKNRLSRVVMANEIFSTTGVDFDKNQRNVVYYPYTNSKAVQYYL
jgi:hypothetical protein